MGGIYEIEVLFYEEIFSVEVPHAKGGAYVGLMGRIILLCKGEV